MSNACPLLIQVNAGALNIQLQVKRSFVKHPNRDRNGGQWNY
jgi:hypothetical protein